MDTTASVRQIVKEVAFSRTANLPWMVSPCRLLPGCPWVRKPVEELSFTLQGGA